MLTNFTDRLVWNGTSYTDMHSPGLWSQGSRHNLLGEALLLGRVLARLRAAWQRKRRRCTFPASR